jgi:ABC-type branched-subunit amino acid transport system ATPase component
MSQNTAITVTGLKKSYKNLKVLEGISFSVQQGSIFALLGPNGAGTGGNQPDRAICGGGRYFNRAREYAHDR